jgi:hypothetical protein
MTAESAIAVRSRRGRPQRHLPLSVTTKVLVSAPDESIPPS